MATPDSLEPWVYIVASQVSITKYVTGVKTTNGSDTITDA